MSALRWLYIVVWGGIRWPMGLPRNIEACREHTLFRAAEVGMPWPTKARPIAVAVGWLLGLRLRTNDPSLHLREGQGPYSSSWTVASRLREHHFPTTGGPWLALVAAAEMLRDRRAA